MAAIPGVPGGNARPRLRPQVAAGTNGASTGARRAAAPARPLPTGWGVVRRRISGTMIVSLALLAVASAGIFQVLQSSRVAEVGYALRALETERSSIDAEIRLLEARLAESSNLEHLREQAVTRLGMVPAGETLSITVDVAAPSVVPLPRRYVRAPLPAAPPPEAAWWEALIGTVPGFN